MIQTAGCALICPVLLSLLLLILAEKLAQYDPYDFPYDPQHKSPASTSNTTPLFAVCRAEGLSSIEFLLAITYWV